MPKIVGSIYEENDYSRFKKLEGNRFVDPQRVKKIKSSIEQVGWITNPIVVNEKMEIIDGQGRFEVLKELGMPVQYVVSEGANLDDCIALNMGQTNWKFTDYVTCYADMGDEVYKMLNDALSMYPRLGTQTVALVLGGFPNAGGAITRSVKTGSFKIYNPRTAERRLQFVDRCIGDFKEDMGRKGLWAAVLSFCYESDVIDNYKLSESLRKQRARLSPIATVQQALAEVEKVYNFRRRETVYFREPFDKWRKERLEACHVSAT